MNCEECPIRDECKSEKESFLKAYVHNSAYKGVSRLLTLFCPLKTTLKPISMMDDALVEYLHYLDLKRKYGGLEEE